MRISKHQVITTTQRMVTVVVAIAALTAVFGLAGIGQVRAADNNIADGIIVDSTLDTGDINVGNGECDDGAGNCTLRAAIQEANTDPDLTVISFDIAPLDGSVKTITLGSDLGNVSTPITIDGFTQDDATPGTAVFPAQPNHTIRVQIDASNVGANVLQLVAGSTGSTFRGLSMYNSGNDLFWIDGGVDDLTFTGNMLGVDASGNQVGDIENAISKDYSGTPIANLTIGGPTAAERNFFSGAGGAAVSTSEVQNLVIQGNVFTNSFAGMSGSQVTSSLIRDNVLNGNTAAGMAYDGDIADITMLNNIVSNTGLFAIRISGANGAVVGAPGEGNRIWGYADVGITVSGISIFIPGANNVIQSNVVGTDSVTGEYNPSITGQGVGIALSGDTNGVLVGGTNADERNIIRSTSGAGIMVSEYGFAAFNASFAPNKFSLLGNEISNTGLTANTTTFGNLSGGLAIDLMAVQDTNDPADFLPDVITNTGVTQNDAGDPDTGSNNSINFPVLNSVTQNGSQATLNFNLDTADSPSNSYRLEFFGSDSVDASGHGEAQTYLGSVTVANGANQQATLTLPSGYSLQGKYVSATTTAVDNTTFSGFGSTSELSNAVTIANASTSALAGTGTSPTKFYSAAVVLVAAAGVVGLGLRRASLHS